MKARKDPQAVIVIEEEHHYEVTLASVSSVNWQEARGSIRVEIPYDGAVLKQGVSDADLHDIGNLHVKDPHARKSEKLHIVLGAGPVWQRNIKSNKKSVTTASYEISEPADSLVSIDGAVLDDVLVASIAAMDDGIFGDADAYNNPLALQMSLWVPDLLAETRPGEAYELETMLLRGENTRQIFMPAIDAHNFQQKLAENLAALANTAGGTVLLGADRNKNIVGVPSDPDTRRTVLALLLKSALRSSPPVSLLRLSEIRHSSGKQVIRIEVSQTGSAIHRLDGVIHKRLGQTNSQEISPVTDMLTMAAPPPPESSLEGVFDRDEAGTISFRSRDDVIVRSSINGLKDLRLGAHLCGLINAGKRLGRIIVTDLSASKNGRLNTWLRSGNDIEQTINSEMGKLLPRLDPPVVEHRHLGNQHIAIIHLPAWPLPVAMYEDRGYIWQNPALNEYKVEELFDKYLELTGSRGQSLDNQDVYLEQATLDSSIRPPEDLEKTTAIEVKERLVYDVEHQARVWEPRPFKRDEDTVGFSVQLTAPLRHLSLTLDDKGAVDMKSPEATGQIRVRLNDVLVSGLEITPHGNEANQWLNTVPVFKRTYLHLNYTAHLNELFERRRKTSLLRILIPDVLLDLERIDDLAQICADIGFRIYDKELYDTVPSVPAKATIRGIRSSGYHDIELLMGLLCQRSELTRELHYDGWHDSRSTYTAILDVRVKLWGTGVNVEQEIADLQISLYHTISRRLQHLRVE